MASFDVIIRLNFGVLETGVLDIKLLDSGSTADVNKRCLRSLCERLRTNGGVK